MKVVRFRVPHGVIPGDKAAIASTASEISLSLSSRAKGACRQT